MWQETNFIPCPHVKSTMVGNGTYWAALTGRQVYGLANRSSEILWEHPAGSFFGSYGSGVCIGDVAVFPDYPDEKEGRTVLRGFDLATGTILWELEKVNPAYGCGILTDGKWLVYSDDSTEGARNLIYADPLTGQTAHSFPTGELQIWAASLGQIGRKSGVVAGGVVYHKNDLDRRLYSAPVSTAASELSRVTEFDYNVLMVESDGESVFAVVSEGKKVDGAPVRSVWRLEGRTGKPLQRVEYPYVRELDRTGVSLFSHHQGLLALHFVGGNKGQGLMLLDFERQEVLWHRGQTEEWYVSRSAITPHGVVGAIFKSRTRRGFLALLDVETGEQLPFAEIEGQIGNNIQWDGRQLIVDCSRGWRIFEWAEKPGDAAETKHEVSVPEETAVDYATSLERARAEILVRVDPDTPATEVDRLLSLTVRAFLDCMTASRDSESFSAKHQVFRRLAKRLFEGHPETGSETIVAGLVQMGVPMSVARNDVMALLSRR